VLLTGKIQTLTNSGAPDYNICGQAATALSLVNLNFKLDIAKDGTYVNLVNTSDLSTVAGLVFDTHTFGNYDIKFTSFVLDLATSTFQAKIEVFYTGTTDVVTWERFNVILTTSKTGYVPFTNVFEFYNYDIGNVSGVVGLVDTTGNQDFNIILTNHTNNLDIYGNQTKTGSNFLTLRRPFSSEIYVYNMIGTQGNIEYFTPDGIFGSGNYAKTSTNNDVYIEQVITLPNSEDCTTGQNVSSKEWFPKLVSGYSSENTCEDCSNNISNTNASYYIDATNTSVFNLHGVPCFLSEFMDYQIKIEVLNYNSEIIHNNSYIETVTYALWTADSSQFLTPVVYTFVPSEIGANVIKFTERYFYDNGSEDIELKSCYESYNFNTCNFWTVTAKETCGQYTFKNCSLSSIILTVQLLDENKVFQDISTNTVLTMASLDITFATDGIYMLKVNTGTVEIPVLKYYSLPSYCALQTCMLNYLNSILCNKPSITNCDEESHYNFNALLANAHTYFLLLNEEMNYNYIYSTITEAKINELYTLKTFIDRFTEYCEASESPCQDCNN